MVNQIDGLYFDQSHGKAGVRVARIWRHQNGPQFIVEWNVNISLVSDCVNAYVGDDNSDIVASDTIKNTVYAKAKERLSMEEFAIILAKHFTSSYRQVLNLDQRSIQLRYSYESISSIPKKPLYFNEKYTSVKKVLVDAFFAPPKEGVYSPSVQRTLYHMKKSVLNRFPDISSCAT